MSLVNVIDLSLSFLQRDLFRKIGFQVEPGDRIGIVGPNGSGKTTLLRLLNGELDPDSGEIRKTDTIRMGYLPQDVSESLSGTLLQALLDSVPNRARIREEIAGMEYALRDPLPREEQVRLAALLAERHHLTAELDRQYPVHRAEKILGGLGFKTEEFQMPFSSLSGGWKMRAVLAGLLYRNPDLLLLDEPTNHLDIPSVRWLEQFLQEYKGAMILVCHDREFLNRQVKKILSLEPEGMRQYSGNYDFYLKTREEERKNLEGRARNQDQKIKEARKFIDRFRAKSSKARQAQSKIKLVKKMELINTHQRVKTIRFSFPEVARSGRLVVEIRGLSKGFDHNVLYQDLDLSVLRGERVAIIGPNGSGKTTLLRMIAGELESDQGSIGLGHGVTLSYYAQHHAEVLDPERTLLEEVYRVVPHAPVSFVRGVCGAFLFSGEDVDKKVGVLSGGERARVCLARMLVKPGNLLVMDEPTNHLDLISSEILIDALAEYNGTLLFVSHNQSFINRLATRIWDIRNGEVKEYPGTLDEYYDHLSRMARVSPDTPAKGMEKSTLSPEEEIARDRFSKKLVRREKAEKRQHITATLKPIQDSLSKLEERISQLENKEKELEKTLADPDIFKDKNRSVPLLSEYGAIRKKLGELMLRWEYKHDELESVKKELGV